MKKILLPAVLFFLLATNGYSQAGELDKTFGKNGLVINDSALFFTSALQSDGKIVVAGNRNGDFAIARYNPDGSPDSSFSQDGLQTTPMSASGVASANAIAIQADGRIIIAGSASSSGNNYDFALARYNPDGSVDSTFSGDGKQVYDIGAAYTFAQAVAIQSDGKIVVAGYSSSSAVSLADFTLARLNPDGSLDKTFSGDGKQTTDFGNNDYIFSIAIQPDGRIVAAGYTGDNINSSGYNQFAIARYNTNGTLDNTFSGDGKQTTDFGFGANANALALQGDGKIVVAGRIFNQTYDFALARYAANGLPDSTFDSDGRLTTGFGNAASASSVVIHNNGKIIAGGSVSKSGFGQNRNFALARYHADGSLDSDFSSDGKQVTETAPHDNLIFALSLSNDKLYAVGNGRSGQFQGYFSVIASYLLGDEGLVPPTVSLIEPANSAGYLAGGNVYLKAAASDADGSISRVEFYNGASLLHVATDTPYTFKWEKVRSGNYTLTAKAVDNSGMETTSAPVHITVVPNKPPTVSMINPADNQTFLKGATLHLEAAAKDADGRIVKVEFYSGATLLRAELKPPYTADWTIGQAGDYVITAKAMDNWGAVTTSAPVHVSVVPNKAPSVSMVTPANGATFTAPATITLEAAALDPDGRITKVEFYNGSTLLTTERKLPYTYQWQNVPAGIYSITAVAQDNWGARTTSAPLRFTVSSPITAAVSHRPALNNEAGMAISLRIAPNPVGSALNIATSGLQQNKATLISVISATGAVMKVKQVSSALQTLQLDVSSLASGVYTLKIINGDRVMYKKFVKK